MRIVSMKQPVSITLILTLSMLLQACGESGEAQVQGALLNAANRLSELATALDNKTVRNANVLRQYVSVLRADRPELGMLLTELEKEATKEGPLYQSLQNRHLAVKDSTEYFESWTDKVAELQSIQSGASIAVYNDALSDSVNVIADMSDGKLARVNAISQQAEQKANNAKNYGAGSQYIGNPHYERWSHGSGGSVWAWYGQYAFFSSMFGGRRHYYNDWAGGRGYSYYHDVGRRSYTSPRQRVAQNDTQQRAKKQFGRGGKTFNSPYAKTRTGSSGMSRASTAQAKSTFKSPYSSSRTSRSKFRSSSRNSGFRTSRGGVRGK